MSKHKVGDIVEHEGSSWVVCGYEEKDFNDMGKGYYLLELTDNGIFVPFEELDG